MTKRNSVLMLIGAAILICTASYLGTTAYQGLSISLTAQPNALIYNSGVQSIPDTTATVMTFDSELWDVGGLHDGVTNSNRITIPTGGDGLWQCDANVVFAASAAGRRTIQIRRTPIATGTAVAFTTGKQLLGDAAVTSGLGASGKIVVVAGDFIDMTAQQVSGGALNANAGSNVSFLSCAKLY